MKNIELLILSILLIPFLLHHCFSDEANTHKLNYVINNQKIDLLDSNGNFLIRDIKELGRISNQLIAYLRNDTAYIKNINSNHFIQFFLKELQLKYRTTKNYIFVLYLDTIFVYKYDMTFINKYHLKANYIYPFNNDIILYSKASLLFNEGSKIGALSKDSIIFEPKFENIFNLSHKYLLENMQYFSGKSAVDTNNSIKQIRKIYNNNLSVFIKRKKMGLMDSSLNIIINPNYDKIWEFSSKFLIAIKNKQCYLLDNKGKETGLVFDEIGNFKKAIITNKSTSNINHIYNNTIGAISSGQNMISFLENINQYNKLFDESEGRIKVKKGNYWGFIDTNGNKVIDFIYEDVRNFNNGICAVRKKGKWGFININGKYLVEPNYQDVFDVINNKFFFKINNYWYLKDLNGNSIKNPKINRIEFNNFGRYLAFNKNKCFIYDSLLNNILIECDSAYYISKNLISTRIGNKTALYSKAGELLIDYDNNHFTFGVFSNFSCGLIIKDSLHGVINEFGKILIHPLYKEIDVINENRFIVEKDNKIGIVDSNNIVIIPINFEYFNYDKDFNQFSLSRYSEKEKVKITYYYDDKFKLIGTGNN